MKRTILTLILIAAAFLAGYWFRRPAAPPPQKSARKVLYYVDPMHPAYKSDKPGIAPDCGMKLEPVYADSSAPPAAAPGMIQISPEKQQLIGVRYGQAEYTSTAQVIRAQGKVAMDETRVAHVHSRTDGWIENVYVNFTGDLVKKGQPMLTVYSPDLLATQQEYLLALKARDILRHSVMRDVAADNDALVDAARKRLELWSLSQAQIEEIRRTGKPAPSVTLYSPAAGYVIVRNAFPNQKIAPDTDLYTLADLSRIWVLASVFESDVPLVRLGQAATVSLPYSGGKTYHSRVSYIQPQVDPATRTVSVRLELDNPALALKPDMFVDVELAVAQPARLTVPAEAVLDSGLAKTVFVDRGNGIFEPREVATGERIGDRIQILSGLKAGERIVTSGNFLIGSESQLKAATEEQRHD
ncbi:MAG: efflux RND transporter periplasmic adaptor subunit [Bryobacteraceae bacterium]|jgi:RND family efflux transporter MFP subunit